MNDQPRAPTSPVRDHDGARRRSGSREPPRAIKVSDVGGRAAAFHNAIQLRTLGQKEVAIKRPGLPEYALDWAWPNVHKLCEAGALDVVNAVVLVRLRLLHKHVQHADIWVPRGAPVVAGRA